MVKSVKVPPTSMPMRYMLCPGRFLRNFPPEWEKARAKEVPMGARATTHGWRLRTRRIVPASAHGSFVARRHCWRGIVGAQVEQAGRVLARNAVDIVVRQPF